VGTRDLEQNETLHRYVIMIMMIVVSKESMIRWRTRLICGPIVSVAEKRC